MSPRRRKKPYVSMSVLVPVELHKEFKHAVIEEGKTESEVLREFMKAYIEGLRADKWLRRKKKGGGKK